MTLGENLQELRRASGLSQEEVAGRLFVSRQSVSKWENGQAEPGVENLKALAELYGVTMDRLILGDSAAEETEDVSITEKERQGAAKDSPRLFYQILVVVCTMMTVFGGLIHWLLIGRVSVPLDLLAMLLGLKFRNGLIYGILALLWGVGLLGNFAVIIFSGKIGTIELQCFGGMLADLFFLWCLFRQSIRDYFHVQEREGNP